MRFFMQDERLFDLAAGFPSVGVCAGLGLALVGLPEEPGCILCGTSLDIPNPDPSSSV